MQDKEEMRAFITEAMTILDTATKALGGLQALLVPEQPPKEEPKALTLVEVRSVLADKSREGFTDQIRTLLEKYGAPKLSEIDPGNYRDLAEEALCLGATRLDLEKAMVGKMKEGLDDKFHAVFEHHDATGLEDLREECYPSFLCDIRRLTRG